jgi:glucose/arabinose dehydrogenase
MALLTTFSLFSQPVVNLVPFASSSDLSGIVGLTHAGDERLFSVLQNGIIRIVNPDGQVIREPFLDIRNKVSTGGERGLLGLAFHPDYQQNGIFFLNYTRTGDGATVVSRWQVLADNPNIADIQSEKIIITIPQPQSNHNGGDIKFGPDGYLYIGMGDGGGGGDPGNFSQNRQSLLGKMLRIDINVDEGYRIPEDNPFAMDDFTLDEIWGLGLRNPWRFSFDVQTGDLWIADVGQNAVEEINMVSSDSQGGENYGWRCYEGNRPFNLNGCNDPEVYVYPVFEYTHQNGDRSITGGFVYRGEDFPALNGMYIFGDFVSGRVFMLDSIEGEYQSSMVGNVGEFQLSTFGEDVRNELYVTARGSGSIFRVTDFCEAYFPVITNVDGLLTVNLNGGEWNEDILIEWYDDFGFLFETQDSIFIPDASGSYYVVLSHSAGCIFESEPIAVIVSSSTIIFDRPVIDVFPNPFNNKFTIESNFEFEVDVVLLDMMGKRLDAQVVPPDSRFSWYSNLPTGHYILKIATPDGHWIKKLVKK